MGKKMWFDDEGMKKGEWTPEEDRQLVAYINDHGICDWRSLPKKAGLQRLGKSCRLRWLNYLRPGIKKGKFTPQEEQDIIKLHAILGNRWAAIAKQMDNRTDNDIKNHWNSCLKKRLKRKGIDPMTHEPINNLTVKSTNKECGSFFSATSSSSMASPSSSLSSGFARLLNKLAAGISSKQHDLDMIKNIISDPRITSSDPKIVGGKEDDFLLWDDEEVRRYIEIDEMEYEMTSYDSVLYESTQILDHLF